MLLITQQKFKKRRKKSGTGAYFSSTTMEIYRKVAIVHALLLQLNKDLIFILRGTKVYLWVSILLSF